MESRRRRVCYQSEGEGKCTLTRDAILRGAQITSSGLCPLITCQSFGLDKKLSNPIGLLNFLEAPPGLEPGIEVLQTFALPLGHGAVQLGMGCFPYSVYYSKAASYATAFEKKRARFFRARDWSGLRGSNPPPPPWQGGALPNELNPRKWCLRSESNQRHGDFQSPALPTELQRHIGWRLGWGSNPRPLA